MEAGSLARCLVLILLQLLLMSGRAQHNDLDGQQLSKRRMSNETEGLACDKLQAEAAVHPSTKVYAANSTEYRASIETWLPSSEQQPACVFHTSGEKDLSRALRIIGRLRVRFAVLGAGHSGNPGFSSTRGILLSMKGFQHLRLSSDKKSVHLGPARTWDGIYRVLNPQGLNVLGGRVAGPGVGGFVTGGGGYGWHTNQYGLTGDTMLSARVVLPSGKIVKTSPTKHPDLFWSIRGGGNRFGIVTSIELQTFPQGQVWGGVRTYASDSFPSLMNAIYNFTENNQDPKAQIIPSFNFASGQVVSVLIAFYDGPSPPPHVFSAFAKSKVRAVTDTWKTRGFPSLVDATPINSSSITRGAPHTVSLQRHTPRLLNVILDELRHWGEQTSSHGGILLSYAAEPFNPYSQHTKSAAWPHSTNAQPMSLDFKWISAANDEYWKEAIVRTAEVISEAARAEGQDLERMYLYPNYAIAGTPAKAMYGPNLRRLRELRKKYDPEGVMGLTTYHEF